MKKTRLRLLAALLSLCLAVTLLPAAGMAAEEEGQIHTVQEDGDVYALLNSGAVSDGDTIRLVGKGWVSTNDEIPWTISKSITIEGGRLELGVSGIILNADVNFRNTALSFNKNARNAIMANGHTLTLDGVTCANASFNLFCGGFINSNNENFTLPDPGVHGVINILGKTTLQGKDTWGKGNIYAGNLCMGGMTEENNGAEANGPENVFSGDAVIRIEDSADSTALGTVYACGAQQRIPVGAQSGKVTLPDPEKYTVAGVVDIQGPFPDIEGAGATRTTAVYWDGSGKNYQATRTLLDLDGLAVESGNLRLKPESRLRGAKDLALFSGAKLDLSEFEKASALEVGRILSSSIGGASSASEGGFLILGPEQVLSVAGEVPGTISVAIGGTNADNTASMSLPRAGHTYLRAPNSTADSFRLLPNSASPSMTLTRDDSGNWTAAGTPGEGEEKIASFGFAAPKTAEVDPDQDAAVVM